MYTDNDWRSYQELYHHGILGQKWGVRRYQNSDGSLTSEGKKRYGSKDATSREEISKLINKYDKRKSDSYQAARLESEIRKFDKKYGVNSEKAAELVSKRNRKIKDLTKEEIDLGREALKENKKIGRILAVSIPIGITAGAAIGGPFGGAYGGTAAIVTSYWGKFITDCISGRVKELNEVGNSARNAFVKKEAKNISSQQFNKEYDIKRQRELAQQEMQRQIQQQMQQQMQLRFQQEIDRFTQQQLMMQSEAIEYSSDILSHHGILGMKWGKKQGPPYPLDASDHSSSEKKAGWKKSLDSTSNSKDSHSTQSGEKSIKDFSSREEAEKYARDRFLDDFVRSTRALTDEEHDQILREADEKLIERTKEIEKVFGSKGTSAKTQAKSYG